MIGSKSQVFAIVLIGFVLLVALLPLAINYSDAQRMKFKNMLGEAQVDLLKTYERGEQVLFYIDQSAILSARQVYYDLAITGGLKKDDCGTFDGYILWNNEGQNCFPSGTGRIRSGFLTRLYGHFSEFPDEKIPKAEYDITLEEGMITGKAKTAVRMNIGEKVQYDFALSDFSGNEKDDGDNGGDDGGNDDGGDDGGDIPNPQADGKCSAIVSKAQEYIGCPYSFNIIAVPAPGDCGPYPKLPVTCATFVAAAVRYGLSAADVPYGDGRAKCDAGTVYKIGTDPYSLLPGDIFASEVKSIYGGYTAWGHTGMYVGRGSVSDKGFGNYCYHTYTPDGNGEPIFIHSLGVANYGLPGVCYASYNQLFSPGSIFVLTSFCRLNSCNTEI